MKQDRANRADAVESDGFCSDRPLRDWGRGLLLRVDRACVHEAFVSFSGLRVEMPSRRWLQQAIDELGASGDGGLAGTTAGRQEHPPKPAGV